MRVLVAGAGSVGMAAAAAASRDNNVVVMENNPERADSAQNEGVTVYRIDASNPKELQTSLDRFAPDVVITAVDRDSINIFICAVVKSCQKARTIATIRDSDYIMKEGGPGVDKVIAPRMKTAQKISHCAIIENALTFSNPFELFYSAVFRVDPGSDICGKYVMDLAIGEGTVVAIYRSDKVLTSVYSAEIRDNDRILFVGSEKAISQFNDCIGKKRAVRNITIIGAGEMGIAVVNAIRAFSNRLVIKVLDGNLELCNNAARKLKGAVVINGQTSDPAFLRSENVDRSDVVIAVSESEQTNLLTCVNAVRFGVRKIITVYSTEEYGNLLRFSGLESLVGYHNVIVNEVSHALYADRERPDSSHILDNPKEAFLELDADESLPFFNRLLGDVYFPEGTKLVLIVRKGSLIYPGLMDRVQTGDRLIFYVASYDTYEFSQVIGRSFKGL